jgi:hypothetical protein
MESSVTRHMAGLPNMSCGKFLAAMSSPARSEMDIGAFLSALKSQRARKLGIVSWREVGGRGSSLACAAQLGSITPAKGRRGDDPPERILSLFIEKYSNRIWIIRLFEPDLPVWRLWLDFEA